LVRVTESPCIAIIGAGCSGAVAAYHILSTVGRADIRLIDPGDVPGQGLAYSTRYPDHLLNVPAMRMSVDPAEPADFVNWLESQFAARFTPSAFVPRSIYGRYIHEKLICAIDHARDKRFEHLRAQAIDLRRERERATISLSNGCTLQADIVVLAIGNATAREFAWMNCPDGAGRVYRSPWQDGALDVSEPAAPVLLAGERMPRTGAHGVDGRSVAARS
jgi:uncharacterized NAD(P)/FAD-binding protein YdhS